MSTVALWVREHKAWIIFIVIGVLLITLSFAMGYLYAKQDTPTPIIIEKCSKN